MHLTVRSVVAFMLIACVSGLGFAGALTRLEMVDAVNARLADKEQFDLLFWHPPKSRSLNKEYRRLYPEGRLLFRQGVFAETGLLCLLMAGWLLCFPLLPLVFLGGGGALLLWFAYFRKTPDQSGESTL